MKIYMILYGNLITDARVQRSANALGKIGNLTILSLGKQKIESDKFNHQLIKVPEQTKFKYFYFVRKVLKIIKNNKPDMIYGHDYYSAYVLNKTRKKYKNIKIVYDAHEIIIPENHKSNFREKLFYHFENKVIKHTNLNIVASKERSLIMKEHYNLKEEPIVVNNISKLPPSKITTVSDELRSFISNHPKLIVYSGAIYKQRGIDKIIKSVGELGSEYGLIIVGNGPYLSYLKKYSTSYNNIFFHESVPYTSLSSIIKYCHIGYIHYPNDNLNNKYCAPNKTYEYASVGLPMISNENLTIKHLFEKFQIGISSNNFKDTILKIFSNYDFYKNKVYEFDKISSWEKEEKELIDAIVDCCYK